MNRQINGTDLVVIDDFHLDISCALEGDLDRGLAPQIANARLLALDVTTRKAAAWLLGPMVVRQLGYPVTILSENGTAGGAR